MLNRMTTGFSDFKAIRDQYLQLHPPSVMGLTKEALFIKMSEEATQRDRLNVQNTVLAVLEDVKFLVLDLKTTAED